jgi:3-deoxy-D-manno-octulosonic-acid transferase
MSERLARLTLAAYRWMGAAIYPFVGGYLSMRAARGKEEHARRRERYGYPSARRPEGPLIWFHAASVGETSAVIPLIEAVAARGITVVLTTGTVTSATIAHDRLAPEIIHQYVPLDLKTAVCRFLDHWRPDLAIIAESEIWPMTILELGVRRIPQVLVNGRLSDRSFARWSRRSFLADALFDNLSHVVAQTDIDAERFRRLGARPVTVSGNLKVDTNAPPYDPADLETLAAQIGDRKTWAAISTFDGEEAIAADVHEYIRPHHGALTIIVPRHPERSDDIEAMLTGRGLRVARRSRGDVIDENTDIFLGDTIGEMGLYLRLTEIVFVGRSLTGEGGQNPLEPAMLGTAVLAGRNVQNFRETYQRLLKDGGGRVVRDGDMLARAVHYLLANDKVRRQMIKAGAATVHDMRGALALTLKALEPYISPLTVKARLHAHAAQREDEEDEAQSW